jgi:hypothetical protein
MKSVMSLAQIVASVLFGWILDRKGARFALVLAHVGTGFSYFGLFAGKACGAVCSVMQ